MTNRTILKHLRVYANGYDISGNSRSIGPFGWTYSEDNQTAIVDAVQGALPNKASLSVGTLNGIFDSTATTGLHALFSSPSIRKLMIPIGKGAAPAVGNPVYCAELNQNAYTSDPTPETIAVNVPFGMASPTTSMLYDKPWGVLLHAKGSETGANTATGGVNNGAASALGGYLMYQIFSITGTGTVTISIDDSANDSTYAALSGATSGAIATASAPVAGIVQLSKTATVRQYLRWQIAFGASATACEFALAFIRG